MPSVDFRLHTANLLVKIEEYKKSVKILDSIIQEEDEHIEAWFLLANNLCHLKKYDSSLECLKNIDLLMKKYKITEAELVKAVEDVKRKVQAGLGTATKGKGAKDAKADQIMDGEKEGDDEEWEDADEEGFETYSEEDVSDDEDEDGGKKESKDVKMKE